MTDIVMVVLYRYVDLYLVHAPGGSRSLRGDTWRGMEAMLAADKCRAIGVSNYEVRHLQVYIVMTYTVTAYIAMAYSYCLHSYGRAR